MLLRICASTLPTKALIKYFEYNGNDTVYGLMLHSSITTTNTKDLIISKNFSVILDFDELEKILLWIDLVKNKSVTKQTIISYNSLKSALTIKYTKDIFIIQYDKNNEESSLLINVDFLNKFETKLNDIKSLWPKIYR